MFRNYEDAEIEMKRLEKENPEINYKIDFIEVFVSESSESSVTPGLYVFMAQEYVRHEDLYYNIDYCCGEDENSLYLFTTAEEAEKFMNTLNPAYPGDTFRVVRVKVE